MSSICGGVMSFSMNKRGMKKYGVWWGLMAYLLPDKQYARYIKYKKSGNDKMAKRVFDRYAISQI
jgi:TnpA family transposase